MLCVERPIGKDVVCAGEVRTVIGLGIGITGRLQGIFGDAKFSSGWILRTPGLDLKLGLRVGSAADLTGREGW